jgi:hypothetical protein
MAMPPLDVTFIGDAPRIVDKGDDPDFDPRHDLPSGGCFDTFRYIETRQELREACEVLQAQLALASEGRIPATWFARIMLCAAWAVMKRLDTTAGAKTRGKIPLWPDSLNKASYCDLFKEAKNSHDPEQFFFEARRRVLAAIEEVIRWCAAGVKAGQSKGTTGPKGKAGRPRLKETDPKLQVYNWLRRERKPGERPAVVQKRLEADRDFMELFEAAKLRWETVFHNADVYFQRPRNKSTNSPS